MHALASSLVDSVSLIVAQLGAVHVQVVLDAGRPWLDRILAVAFLCAVAVAVVRS